MAWRFLGRFQLFCRSKYWHPVLALVPRSTSLDRYFARVKSAIKNHPELHGFVEDLFSWFDIWTAAVDASPPTFQDPITSSNPQVRNLTLRQLEKDISRLRLIVGREYGDAEKMRRHIPRERFTASQMQEALTSRLEQAYDPPGTLRVGGERHDNDFTNIRDIRIAPTNQELLCPLPPYLPAFLPSAPHHLPESSMERHLDIQFRLLREELTYATISLFHLPSLYVDDVASKYFYPAIRWGN